MNSNETSSVPARSPSTVQELAGMIDHTLLHADATRIDIEALCKQALANQFCAVCVNSYWVSYCKDILKDSPVRVCSVAGFPLGAQVTQGKQHEVTEAIAEGADEIDVVLNIGALKSEDFTYVWDDIHATVEACRKGEVVSKIILETCLLTDSEKIRACEICVEAKANFVKTSTGFSTGGATIEDVALLAKTVGPKQVGVKASGGIRTCEDMMNMISAGATRIGTSSGVKIIEAARQALPSA